VKPDAARYGVLAYLNRQNGEPDIDQNGLAVGSGSTAIGASLLGSGSKEGHRRSARDGVDRRARCYADDAPRSSIPAFARR